mmetsp:Transcript_707/g.1681  ORF Transcript_707/g.1681 Transcript_707/m.1681 type:complete len:409 (+) Transcript_707:47-1273(+)
MSGASRASSAGPPSPPPPPSASPPPSAAPEAAAAMAAALAFLAASLAAATQPCTASRTASSRCSCACPCRTAASWRSRRSSSCSSASRSRRSLRCLLPRSSSVTSSSMRRLWLSSGSTVGSGGGGAACSALSTPCMLECSRTCGPRMSSTTPLCPGAVRFFSCSSCCFHSPRSSAAPRMLSSRRSVFFQYAGRGCSFACSFASALFCSSSSESTSLSVSELCRMRLCCALALVVVSLKPPYPRPSAWGRSWLSIGLRMPCWSDGPSAIPLLQPILAIIFAPKPLVCCSNVAKSLSTFSLCSTRLPMPPPGFAAAATVGAIFAFSSARPSIDEKAALSKPFPLAAGPLTTGSTTSPLVAPTCTELLTKAGPGPIGPPLPLPPFPFLPPLPFPFLPPSSSELSPPSAKMP